METKPREAELSLFIPTWAKGQTRTADYASSPGILVWLELCTSFQLLRLAFPLISTGVVVRGGVTGRPLAKDSVLPMEPRLPLRITRPKNQWELSMTKVIPDESGPNAVLTRPWSRYVDAGVGW